MEETMNLEEASSRFLATASELYDDVNFLTDSVFNMKAPEPWVSFMIGGICCVIAIYMWLRRLLRLKKELNVHMNANVLLRAMISAAVDSDEAFYTIVSFAAISFFFLGGLQLNFVVSFSVMLGSFVFASLGDTIRVILAFREADSLADIVVTSHLMDSKLRKATTELNPKNVYEDLGRNYTIVVMVFVTQCILIGFVVTDIFDSQTTNCRDGSKNCPVVGTFGSWGFYVLGIFMACVFLLGPKTAFGQSEQNPSYWLQLLVSAKKTGSKCTWYDPVKDKTLTQLLSPNDFRIWVRFAMSFVINGVGFHILVHALPLQVASQSSLTGVVFRAVGMMYLVDLDDTPGFKLTIVEQEKPPETGEKLDSANDSGNKPPEIAVAKPDDVQEVELEPVLQTHDVDDIQERQNPTKLSAEADKIIEEARAKLEALATNGVPQGDNSLLAKQTLLIGVGKSVDSGVSGASSGLPVYAHEGDNHETGHHETDHHETDNHETENRFD